MIHPTRGRSLLFFLANSTPGFAGNGGESYAAILAGAHNDGHILSLCVFDDNGVPHPKTGVPLVQEGNDKPAGDYAHWMKFQLGQAQKAEQADDTAMRKVVELIDRLTNVEQDVSRLIGASRETEKPAADPQASDGTTGAQSPQPPVDNAHIAPGSEKFSEPVADASA